MDTNDTKWSEATTLFLTAPQRCSYLPQRNSVSLLIDPSTRISTPAYDRLAKLGFRRSGDLFYRPQCPGCQQCIPVRIPAQHFTPNRAQRRTWRRNRDLSVREVPSEFHEEHFALYQRYQHARHRGGGMDTHTPNDFFHFLVCRDIDTRFIEFRLDQELLGVAVVDHLLDGLSAVYTFYHPDFPGRSLGTFAILSQIELARRQGLQWVYLGYWIENSEKMRYKRNFQPLEGFNGSRWLPIQERTSYFPPQTGEDPPSPPQTGKSYQENSESPG